MSFLYDKHILFKSLNSLFRYTLYGGNAFTIYIHVNSTIYPMWISS